MSTAIPPIRKVTVYKNDVVVHRAATARQSEIPPRGTIKEFSRESRRRLAFTACNTSVTFRQMVTLTYPAIFPSDGALVKRHNKLFLDSLRRHLLGRLSYLWFLEFQQRGAPHIHYLIDAPWPRTREDVKNWRNYVAQRWYEIVDSGDYKHRLAGTRTEKIRKPDGAARYTVKYAMKMRQKTVPELYQNVGRFWSCSRDVIPQPVQEHRVTEDDVRGALEGWPYAPAEHRPVYKVLYRTADRFIRKD